MGEKKVPGPFDIWPFFTQPPVLFWYIEAYGVGGGVIQESLILAMLIVTIQNGYGNLGEVYGKYPGWVKVSGPFDLLLFLQHTLPWFAVKQGWVCYTNEYNFSYANCYIPKIHWFHSWDMGGSSSMVDISGTSCLLLILWHIQSWILL